MEDSNKEMTQNLYRNPSDLPVINSVSSCMEQFKKWYFLGAQSSLLILSRFSLILMKCQIHWRHLLNNHLQKRLQVLTTNDKTTTADDLITMSEMKAVQPFPVFCDHYQISPHNLSSKPWLGNKTSIEWRIKIIIKKEYHG